MIFLRQPGYEPAGCRTYYPQKQKPRHSRAIRLTPRKGRAFYARQIPFLSTERRNPYPRCSQSLPKAMTVAHCSA